MLRKFLFLLIIPLALHASDRPNFIFILIDDLGWKDIGFAGSNLAPTPNIDALAKKGLIFKQAYASAPNCAPTRACLMTGQYTPRHGIYTVIDDRHTPGSPQQKIMAAESKSELPSNTLTLADILKSNDYSTGMVGMWNLGRGKTGPASPIGRGFQYFTEPKTLGFDKDAYVQKDGSELTDVMTDAAIKWMTEHKDGPFFLYLHPTLFMHPSKQSRNLSQNTLIRRIGWRQSTRPRSSVWIKTLESFMRNWKNSD